MPNMNDKPYYSFNDKRPNKGHRVRITMFKKLIDKYFHTELEAKRFRDTFVPAIAVLEKVRTQNGANAYSLKEAWDTDTWELVRDRCDEYKVEIPEEIEIQLSPLYSNDIPAYSRLGPYMPIHIKRRNDGEIDGKFPLSIDTTPPFKYFIEASDLRDIKISRLTRDDVKAELKKIANGHPHYKSKRSVSTVNHYHSALSCLLDDVIQQNPEAMRMGNVALLIPQPIPVQVYTPHYTEYLPYNEMARYRDKRAIDFPSGSGAYYPFRYMEQLLVILATTGIRIQFAISLTFEEVILDGPNPHVFKQMKVTRGTQKAAKKSKIALNPDAVLAFRTLRKSQLVRQSGLYFPIKYRTTGVVRSMNKRSAAACFILGCKKFDLKWVDRKPLHAWRSYCAVTMAEQGASALQIMRQLDCSMDTAVRYCERGSPDQMTALHPFTALPKQPEKAKVIPIKG